VGASHAKLLCGECDGVPNQLVYWCVESPQNSKMLYTTRGNTETFKFEDDGMLQYASVGGPREKNYWALNRSSSDDHWDITSSAGHSDSAKCRQFTVSKDEYKDCEAFIQKKHDEKKFH
jgi:hypothetical protein